MLGFVLTLFGADKFYKYTSYDPFSDSAKLNYADFENPKSDSKVGTYYFWMNGKVTKDGIVKDLDAMAKNNYGEVLIFNVDIEGKDALHYNSDLWFEMLDFTCENAKRNDMKVSMHNCSGWSEAGGKWIKPEQSMKKLTWTIKSIKGNSNETTFNLEKPAYILDFYEDIAVVVWKTNRPISLAMEKTFESLTVSNPKIKAPTDAEIKSLLFNSSKNNHIKFQGDKENKDGTGFVVKFKEPFEATKIFIGTTFFHEVPDQVYLEVSDDGKEFRKIKKLELSKDDNLIDIGKIKAQYWRLMRYNSPNPTTLVRQGSIKEFIIEINSFELLAENEASKSISYIPRLQAKSAQAFDTNLVLNYANNENVPAEACVDLNSVQVFKNKLSDDGKFTFKFPDDATYSIMRLGYTSTGEEINPSYPGAGLEVDKMSKEHVNSHFDNHPQNAINYLKKYVGNTFTILTTDSWECREQNWTENFDKSFFDRNGYNFLKFIPVFAGECITSAQITENFLSDFMNTTSALVHDNFYAVMQERCAEGGILYKTEPAKAMYVMNHVDTFMRADIPMDELWQRPRVADVIDTVRLDWQRYYPISVCHFFGKRKAACESLTCNTGQWAHTPWTTKGTLDSILMLGYNKLSLHCYVHQPDDNAPGLQLGTNGVDFNRHMTWWGEALASSYFQYANRVSYMQTQGKFESEFLYIYADLTPATPIGWPTFPNNDFSFDLLNATVIKEDFIKIEDGKLVSPGKMRYSVMQLANTQTMHLSLTTLQKLKVLIEQGAVVSGFKPNYPYYSNVGGKEAQEEWHSLCDTIFGNGEKQIINLGKGKVLVGYTSQEIVNELKLKPTIKFEKQNLKDFSWSERKTKDARWYILRNNKLDSVSANIAFRVENSDAFIWNPEDGKACQAPAYREKNGYTTLPLSFEPAQTLIVVFKDKSNSQRAVDVIIDSKSVFAGGDDIEVIDNTKISKDWAMLFTANVGENIRENNFVAQPERMHTKMNDNSQSCASLSVTKDGIKVFEHGANFFKCILEYNGYVGENSNIALIYVDNTPSIWLDNKIVAKSGKTSPRTVHPVESIDGKFNGTIKNFEIKSGEITSDEILAFFNSVSEDKKNQLSEKVKLLVQNGIVKAECFEDSKIEIKLANGTSRTLDVKNVKKATKVEGPFTVCFDTKLGAPEQATFDSLYSWTESDDIEIKNYSGKAVYKKEINIDADAIATNKKIYLQIDDVGDVAEFKMNGKDVGQRWRKPFVVDITDFVKAGKNQLEIAVANTWVNRLLYEASLEPEQRKLNYKSFSYHFPSKEDSSKTMQAWKYGPMKSGLMGEMKIIYSVIE